MASSKEATRKGGDNSHMTYVVFEVIKYYLHWNASSFVASKNGSVIDKRYIEHDDE